MGGGGAMLGGMIGAAGSVTASQGEAQAARANAATNSYNATLSIAQSAEEERRQRAMSYKTIGAQRAAVGASGITMEGSPLDVIQNSAANAELDALTIRHKGQAKAWAYQRGAQADLLKADYAQQKEGYGFASNILGGFAGGME